MSDGVLRANLSWSWRTNLLADDLDAATPWPTAGVPSTFATGYDQSALRERLANAPRVEKPLKGRHVRAALTPLLTQKI